MFHIIIADIKPKQTGIVKSLPARFDCLINYLDCLLYFQNVLFYSPMVICDCKEFIAAHIWKNSDDSFLPKASRVRIIVTQPLLFTMAIHGGSISSCIILIVLASMFSGYIINLWPLLPPH